MRHCGLSVREQAESHPTEIRLAAAAAAAAGLQQDGGGGCACPSYAWAVGGVAAPCVAVSTVMIAAFVPAIAVRAGAEG